MDSDSYRAALLQALDRIADEIGGIALGLDDVRKGIAELVELAGKEGDDDGDQ